MAASACKAKPEAGNRRSASPYFARSRNRDKQPCSRRLTNPLPGRFPTVEAVQERPEKEASPSPSLRNRPGWARPTATSSMYQPGKHWLRSARPGFCGLWAVTACTGTDGDAGSHGSPLRVSVCLSASCSSHQHQLAAQATNTSKSNSNVLLLPAKRWHLGRICYAILDSATCCR